MKKSACIRIGKCNLTYTPPQIEVVALPAPWATGSELGQAKVDSPWRDKKGIAEYLGCSVRHVTDLQRRKIIPFLRSGRFVRFNIHDCDKALKALETKSVSYSSLVS